MTILSVMRIVPSLWCFLFFMMTLIPMIATDVVVVVTAYVVVVSPAMYHRHHHRHRYQVDVSQSWTRCYSNFDNDTNHETHNKNNNDESPIDSVSDDHRRRILHRGILAGGTLVSTAATTFSPQPVNALLSSSSSNNRLFQSNTLLTNPILEQLRIWEQEEADNIKYNGELERGDAGNKGQINAYPSLLIPILTISQDLSYLYQILVGSTHPTTTTTQPNYDRKASYERAQSILSNHTVYDTIPFKRTFNAYADNVYYSDPDRANLYLGGGATPKSIQSLAYLLRNDILDNLDNLRAELQYQLQPSEPPSSDDDDVRQLTTAAYTAMQKYLDIIPPNEYQRALELLQQPPPK